jgi:AraC-like DNA-binding protein
MTGGSKNMTVRSTPSPEAAFAAKAAGPTVGAGFARGLLEFAVRKGADRQALMDKAGLNAEELADQDGRVPMAKYVALMRAGIALSGDPALALHFGEAINIARVSIIGQIGRASETMSEAFVQLNRFVRLVVETENSGDYRFQKIDRDGATWIVDTRLNANAFPELTESAFAQLICHTREFGHDSNKPMVKLVHVTHARPKHWQEYERVFAAPVEFGRDWNAMQVEPEWTEYRVAREDQYLGTILRGHAEGLLKELEASRTVRAQVEAILLPRLPAGETGVEDIAAKMGVSRQTLYRKLKDEGVTYEQALDRLRRRMALHCLNDRKLSVNETAYLVGFSDPAAFSRAFKRWTGSSPGKHRG